jgi:hypothetical protein
VTALAQRLERTLEAPIRANLYAGAGGFPLHRNDEDALILQIAGQNQWAVHGVAAQEPNEKPAAEIPLKEGDALYLPQGCWHSAAASKHPTLQLTLSIHNPTGIGLLKWMTELLKHQESFQAAIPRFAGPAVQTEYIATIRRTIAGLCREPGLLERHGRYLNNTAPRRPAAGVPWSPELSGEVLITLAAPRRLRVRRADKNTIDLKIEGERSTFPEDAAQLFHYLSDHAPVSISAFYQCFEGEFEREELTEFLAVLSQGGVIGLNEPDSI